MDERLPSPAVVTPIVPVRTVVLSSKKRTPSSYPEYFGLGVTTFTKIM